MTRFISYSNQDCAAALTTALKIGFWGLLVRRKSPIVFILEAESLHRWHDSTNCPEKSISSLIFEHTSPSGFRYFNAVDFEDPRPRHRKVVVSPATVGNPAAT